MTKLAILLFAVTGVVLTSSADSGMDLVQIYTAGYATNESRWTLGIYTSYTAGVQPTINPYASPTGVSNLSGKDTTTFTFTYDGHYAANWAICQHGYLVPHLEELPNNPYSLTVTYSQLAKIVQDNVIDSSVDLIPLFAEMKYSLSYDPGQGGSWTTGSGPAATNLWWSNAITSQPSNICSRTGYSQVGWRPTKDASGNLIECKKSFAGKNIPVTNHNQSVTLYAQWSVNQYPLHLIIGKGIESIHCEYFKNGVAKSVDVSEDTVIDADYASKWSAYATAKPGYEYSATTSLKPTTGTMSTDSSVFDPSANAKSFTVSFNGNGHTSGSTGDKTFVYDEAGSLPANGFVRGYTVGFAANGGSDCSSLVAKYKFDCWNSQIDGNGEFSYADQQMVTNPCGSTGSAVMLYAKWDTNNVTAVTLPTTTWSGHTHSGWYADFDRTEYIGAAGATYMPTNDITLYADWDAEMYSVKFYDDDPNEDGNLISEQSIPWHGSAVEPDPRPTKGYYKFSNWNTTGWKSVESDLQVWPEWSGKAYKIVYNSNYSNGKKEKTVTGKSCGVALTDDEVEIKNASTYNYEKVGYTFDGWDTNKYATVKKWAAGETLHYSALDEIGGGKESVNFYAVWSPNAYRVRFNGGSDTAGTMSDQSFEYGVAKSLTANAFTRADEQTFLHWTNSVGMVFADCETVSNLTTTADATIDLYAVWSNYHYVRFDKNGATNECADVVQRFLNAETNSLSANVYGKTGYAFAGWATNAVAATNLCVTYTNCQSAAFPEARANETNVLHAVWTTNRYTIVFNPGSDLESPYFFGRMESLTNCAYDTPIAIKCGYTNYCSQGLLGWSLTKGATEAEYPVTGKSAATLGNDAVVSNLTAEVNGSCTLYAVWADVGDLSKAVGISNAVLVQESDNAKANWLAVTNYTDDPGVCAALVSSMSKMNGVWRLSMKVVGAGRLFYCSYWERYGDDPSETTFKFRSGSLEENLPDDPCWSKTNSVTITGAGEHEICWVFDGSFNNGSPFDKICLDDISWIPDPAEAEITPGGEAPKYETEEAANAAAANAKVVRPNDAVKGVVSEDDYRKMFDILVVAAADKWTLVPELSSTVSNEVQSALSMGSSNLVEAVKAKQTGAIEFTISTKAGLYYGVAATNDVTGIRLAVPTNWVLGEGSEKQPISVNRPSDERGFFEFRATAIPPK